MNQVSLADSVYLHFGTSSASTGAATNADSTPTVTVAEDGTDMGYAPTVTNVATGLYKVQIDATAGNGFEAGKRYSVYAVVTVGGITGRDGIGEFEVLATDLNTGVASVTGAVGSVTGLTAANLDVAVSTRLATSGYTAPDNATIATIQADTNDIQTRLPAALIGGRIDATVGAMQANTFTASALATDAVTEIQSGLSTLDAAGVRLAVGMASANLDTQLAALAAYVDTVEATLALVKAQTDQLAFTSGAVQADVQRVRAQALVGTGIEADPWGPA